MKKFILIGAAAISFSVLASPVMARHVPGESIYCATREPGNPHSKYCDYIEWSKWRQKGGWDPTLDDRCSRDPSYVPGECGLDPQSRASWGY